MKKNIILKSIFTAFLFVLSFSAFLSFNINQANAQGIFQCAYSAGGGWYTTGNTECEDGFTYSSDLCSAACLPANGCSASPDTEVFADCIPDNNVVLHGWGDVCDVSENHLCEDLSGDHNFDLACRDKVCLLNTSAPLFDINEGCYNSSECFGELVCLNSFIGVPGTCQPEDLPQNECFIGQTVINYDGNPLCHCSYQIIDDKCERPVIENNNGSGGGGGGGGGNTDESGAIDGGGGTTVTADDFDALNPLKNKSVTKTVGAEGVSETLTTPGAIISRLLEFSFPLAGLILFIMLFWGGFEITYGASTSKSMEAGKNRITAALIGFFLLFSSYWIIQILEVVLGIKVFL